MDLKSEESKPVIYTENPFSHNFISMKKSQVNDLPVPTIDQVVATPLYNAIGKMLGINDPHRWKQHYDKVFTITEWARERSDLKNPDELMTWIKNASKYSFTFGRKKIESLFEAIRKINVNST